MTLKIYLCRHGRTPWNEQDGMFQTHSDGYGNRLSQNGIEDAQKICEILSYEHIDIAIRSPKYRNMQTLDIVRAPHEVIDFVDVRMDEKSCGFLDGAVEAQWCEWFPQIQELFSRRRENKYSATVPRDIDLFGCYAKAYEIAARNGEERKMIPAYENHAQIAARTAPFVRDLKGFAGSNVLIVGHQGANSGILGNLLVKTQYLNRMEDIINLRIPNDLVYRIDCRADSVTVYHNHGRGWHEGLKVKIDG